MTNLSKNKIEELEKKYDVKITSNEMLTQFCNYRYCVFINDDGVSVLVADIQSDEEGDRVNKVIDEFIDSVKPTDELEDIIETFIYHFYGEILYADADVFETDEHNFRVNFNYNLTLEVDTYGATLYLVDNDCNFFEVETDLESGKTNDRYERIEVIKKYLRKFSSTKIV